jgi:hypothetical protein
MRAILINAFEKKLEEINLPEETAAFRRAVKYLIKADEIQIIHINALLSIIFDPIAFVKADVPTFRSALKEGALFGNYICIGRNSTTYQRESLCREYEAGTFQVRWTSQQKANIIGSKVP